MCQLLVTKEKSQINPLDEVSEKKLTCLS